MHILTVVFFNAPNGGLHDNVLAYTRYMKLNGHKVSVICKQGPFFDKLLSEGIRVIETDFTPLANSYAFADIEKLHEKCPVDIVHVHPFASRKLGMMVAQVLGLPCVVTMHGKYLDELPDTIHQLDAVFTVSEGIRQYLTQECGVPSPEKLHVIPNAPNAKLFKQSKFFKAMWKTSLPASNRRVTISLVSRLDQDKMFILEVFYKAVVHAAEHYPGSIHWQIVGEGTLKDEVSQTMEQLRGENTVGFIGWVQGKALRDAYRRSDVVIAPGRCALEAMSCGVPAIALGSKDYSGLVGPVNWQHAVYTNFGGVGAKASGYEEGAVERDLDTLLESSQVRRTIGQFGRCIAKQFFNEDKVHERLLGFYLLVILAYRAEPRVQITRDNFLVLRLKGVSISKPQPDHLILEHRCEHPESLQFAWYLIREDEVIEKRMYSPDPRTEIILPEPGLYSVQCYVKDMRGNKVSFIGAEVALN